MRPRPGRTEPEEADPEQLLALGTPSTPRKGVSSSDKLQVTKQFLSIYSHLFTTPLNIISHTNLHTFKSIQITHGVLGFNPRDPASCPF